MPTISIIVPVYNVEKYLNRCVDSILNQTFTDFELILVNDGSTDNSGKICDEYAKKDQRVKAIHKSNGGVSSARNRGLGEAIGKYVMFCDSDDYVADNWCSMLLYYIRKFPDRFIVSDVWKVYSDDREIFRVGGSEKIETFYQLYKRYLSCSIWNKIYDIEVLRKNSIFFENGCPWSEDVPFNTKYCQLCNGIMYIDTPLYYYCNNIESATKKYYPDFLFLNLKCFIARLPLISKSEMGDFCDEHLSIMVNLFNNVFDERNTLSFFQKLKYNNKIMNTAEFIFCVNNATGKLEGEKTMKLLKLHNYYLYYTVYKISGILKHKRHN